MTFLSSLKSSPTWLNTGTICYTVLIYGTSIFLLLQKNLGVQLLGSLLLVHSLVLSAVLIHELIHGNLFKARSLNAGFGQLLTHLNGACYAPYEDVVQHHFNHHVYHADFVPFDISDYFKALPDPIRKVFVALEWAYFPIFEYVMRWRLILAPFHRSTKRHLRGRTLAFLAYRGALFVGFGWLSWRGLLMYAIAYTCFINLMRFADAFHHTYDYVVVGEDIPKRDRLYEDANTFSNLVSVRHPILNLLYLNFSYHNAHHHDMRCPWYALPQLHQRLYGDDSKTLLPLPQLVSNYHRFRIQRLFGGQGDAVDVSTRDWTNFTGGVGVSFLTPP